jgi:L-serine dehydratase
VHRTLRVRRGEGETGYMIASNEIPADRRVDFDTTVSAMALTAKEMNSKYKETSEGGLAVSVVLC